ncbi:Glycosyl transferase family 2 [Pseudobutyrivibrio sp. JW11]|uniref:glycosyltransferase n=1 Tax=Pseudobutyrivibrio sp. JW11 TaxID=1855302 RepID=UPI0008F2C0A4|nr:glycosyltransferase [Pseudobutyrivibrio sp. JW11]SFO34884.1 Glycosyl transferase family 2 [Pseudobutyrivibrio sp. JW11]
MLPLVSIITPTYRRFDYIERVIKSVLGQDYGRIEYIITDDGSENCPIDLINSIVKKNQKGNIEAFRLIVNSNNIGTVKNLNNAVRQSSGEYIMFLAGDDIFYNSHVVSEVVQEFLDRRCNTLAVTRYCVDSNDMFLGYLPHLADRKIIQNWDRKEQHERFIKAIYKNMASGSALYFKRDFFVEIGGFSERYILWEDGPFIYKCTKNERIEVAYEIVGIRYRMDGVSSNPNEMLLKDGKLFNKLEIEVEKKNSNWMLRGFINFRTEKDYCPAILLALRYPLVSIVFLYEFIRDKILWLLKK